VPEAAFSYALLRLVPRLERGESMNVGVVLFSRQHDYLDLRVRVDEERLAVLGPGCDADMILERLTALRIVASGDRNGGPLAALPASERFGWLTAPSSTMIQPSEVHTGMTADPDATLDHLFRTLVA
jgi:Protein of unknown function (DUF3037)